MAILPFWEAVGWTPDEHDGHAFKDAMVSLKESVWRDERGIASGDASVEDDEDLKDYAYKP